MRNGLSTATPFENDHGDPPQTRLKAELQQKKGHPINLVRLQRGCAF